VTRVLVRVSALQALSFGVAGAVYPFLALELRQAGIGGWVLVCALISAPILRLVGGPLWGWTADRLGSTRAPLLLAGGLAVLGTLAVWGLPGALVIGGTVVLALGRAGATPLVEATSVHATDRDPGRYGAVRRWGSAGFMLAVIAGSLGRDHLGLSPLLLAAVLGVALLLVALGLPRVEVRDRTRAPIGPLLRDPVVWLVLGTSALHFAGIAMYDGFFAVHLERLGLPTGWLGLSIGLGIATELVTLSMGGWLLARLGPRGLLLAAVLISAPRWLVTALGTEAWMIVPIHVVHGFAYGGYWLASIALLTERAPERLTGSVQGLLAASAGGVGALIGNLAGSTIVEHLPSAALFWTALGLTGGATVLALGVGIAGRSPGAQSAISVERKK